MEPAPKLELPIAKPLTLSAASAGASPVVVKPPSTTPSWPSVMMGWPRSAQLTTAFLLGMVVVLLAIQTLGALRWSARPTELEHAAFPSASRVELLQLPGVGDHLAERIEKYREEQGPFRRVDDLQGIHGVGPATVDRLRDWVMVDSEDEGGEHQPLYLTKKKSGSITSGVRGGKKGEPTDPIDINYASAAVLQSLPGIGEVTAQRIIEERAKKPFARVEDLTRVPRLKGKTLEKLRPFITVKPTPTNQEETNHRGTEKKSQRKP
jgi:competence ComEA-like helix-hairpin-helix protein